MNLDTLIYKRSMSCIAQCSIQETRCMNPLCQKRLTTDEHGDVYAVCGTEDSNLTWMYCTVTCAEKGYLFQEGFKHGLNFARRELKGLIESYNAKQCEVPFPVSESQ